jgi:hypothetical protein
LGEMDNNSHTGSRAQIEVQTEEIVQFTEEIKIEMEEKK